MASPALPGRVLAAALAIAVVAVASAAEARIVDQSDVDVSTVNSSIHAVAHNTERDEFLSVHQGTGTFPPYYATRYAADGSIISGPTVVLTSDDLDPFEASLNNSGNLHQHRLVYHPGLDEYLLVTLGGGGPDASDRGLRIYGLRLSSTGSPIGSVQGLNENLGSYRACYPTYPDVAPDPANGNYQLVFRYLNNSNGGSCGFGLSEFYTGTTLIQSVAADLTPGTPTQIGPVTPIGASEWVTIDRNPVTGEFGVGIASETTGGTLVRVSAAHAVLGETSVFPDQSDSQVFEVTAVAHPTTGEWLALTTVGGKNEIASTVVSPTGAILHGPQTVGQGAAGEVVGVASGWLAVADSTTALHQIGPDGRRVHSYDPFTNVGNGAPALAPGADGTTVLAVGRSNEAITARLLGVEAPGLLPLVPARLLETRDDPDFVTIDGEFEGIGRRGARSTTELLVTGRGGVAADASAVQLNVTAIAPDGPGFVTVFPCGEDLPTTSSLNYGPGDVVPAAVTAKVGTGGTVCIYTYEAADLIVDVTGQIPADGSISPIVPARFLETRDGPMFTTIDGESEGIGRAAARSVTRVTVAGRDAVPADAQAVLMNVTAIAPDLAGFLTIYSCDDDQPDASNVNYGPGDVVANLVLTEVSASGEVCIYSYEALDLVADVNAFVPADGGLLPVTPARLYESRSGFETVDGLQQGTGRLGAQETATVGVWDRAGVPSDATGVMLNVAAVDPSGPGFVTMYPCDADRPGASNVNYGPGDVVANNVYVKLSGTGQVCAYSFAETDLIVDVIGYTVDS